MNKPMQEVNRVALYEGKKVIVTHRQEVPGGVAVFVIVHPDEVNWTSFIRSFSTSESDVNYIDDGDDIVIRHPDRIEIRKKCSNTLFF